ncbi:MAG TPA: tail fiber domain-containing protein [Oligoflexus sp.]|uniref:tail fiber domain-containing protein n=1 Tax=Oligoflexus sp. TaxID=1971216 RepID=UPI002D2FE2AD|nr:tail fiber domain-containing protein [Oligoflexus sp.]HYX38321.1 tail fiber domain-containing protein [Oligoflexus sp.]
MKLFILTPALFGLALFASTHASAAEVTSPILSIHEARMKKIEGVNEANKSIFNSGIFTGQKLLLNSKWLLSDTHNDDWLRIFGNGTNDYYGGLAAHKLWSRELYIGGSKWILKDTGDEWLRINAVNGTEEAGWGYWSTGGVASYNFAAQSSYQLAGLLKLAAGADCNFGSCNGHWFEFQNMNGSLANVKFQTSLSGSDIRLKDNVKPLENSLEKVLKLRPVSYHLKAAVAEQKDIGFIAQEVQKQFPELVVADQEGMLAMNYPSLTAPIVQAIQQQQAIVEQQQALIEAQKKALEALQEDVARLRAQIVVKASL